MTPGPHDDDEIPSRLTAEDAEDALLEGDRTFTPGTISSALSYPDFRLVFGGSLFSNVGTWAQNTVVAAYVLDLTGNASSVGLIVFAQLGPLLLLSLVGGALADRFDNRRLVIGVAIEQLLFSLILAWLTRGADASFAGLFFVMLMIGIGQAIFSPTFAALVPAMVRREDLTGAIALNSASLNLSRVVGPAIGGLLYASVGASWAFIVNAVSYLFIIGTFLVVKLPTRHVPDAGEPTGVRRMLEGFAVARRDPVIGRCLLTMTTFSLICLPFVVQMPVIAQRNFGIEPKSTAYGALYAMFGLGALIGALSIGTFLANRSLEGIVRVGLGGFALSLGAFALLHRPEPAFPLAVVLGFFYFATVTSLLTVLQRRLDDRVRGRVMALWVMAFGGTVPIGGLIAGPIIEATSVTVVTLFGAIVAAVLIPLTNLAAADPPSSPQAA